MLMRSWLQALCAFVCILALAGCGDECVDQYDCRNKKGPPPAGKEYVCNDKHACELKDTPSPEPTCSPECAGSEFCDTSSGTGVCRTCSATQGCSATAPVCDTAANNGKGVCKACTDTASGNGTDQGCSATAPVCDTAASNGAGVCKACVDSAQGNGTDVGCSATAPVCDTSGGNGAGVCKACVDSAQGNGTDVGCSDAAPICNPLAANGAGACRTCTDTATGNGTDLGCSDAAPICNTSAASGAGACRACSDTATGNGTDLGCSATAPICNLSAANGVGACKACVDSATGSGTDVGCSATVPFCDATASNGAGLCKACLDSATGSGTDLGCSATTPLCDGTASNGAGTCKACMDSATGNGTDVGCSGTTPLCDTAAASGAGVCKVCMDSAASGNTDLGCSGPASLCDATANSGLGTCKVCLTSSNEGCPGAQTCNATGTACEGCADNSSCTNASTPICKPPPPVAVCVECTDDTHCGALRPTCNTATNFCGCTSDAACKSAAGNTDFCDTAANSGGGECRVCVTNANCASVDASKPFCDNQTACIQCRTNADCSLSQVCDASKSCVAPPGADPAGTSAQIQAFIDAPVGPFTTPITIENAFVTYIKPVLGDPASGDATGFFLQAQYNGPAMFVDTDPSQLQVGDRITLTVGEKFEYASGKVRAARSISGLTIVARGYPVQNLNTATPPGLAVDVSSATDLVTGVEGYFGKILHLTGTMSGTVFGSGQGHSTLNFKTAGITTGTLPRLRVPTTFATQYDFVDTCTFTLDVGPMWKNTNTATPPVTSAQPSAYGLEDFSALSCPAPKLINGSTPTATTLKLAFDRNIDPASITNAAAQFTFTGGLTTSSAVVTGREVLLTTSPQTTGTSYTLTVATSVKDTLGVGIGTPNTLTFTGFAPLVVRGGSTTVSGAGFTGATNVTIGGTSQTFTVDSDTQLTVTNLSDATPLGSQPIVVTTPSGPVSTGNTTVINLVINELDSDQVGTDAAEFVEISTGVPNLKLSGFVLVFFNGTDDKSYLALDLNATADANGLIVAGNTGVNPNGPIIPGNMLQNGEDAAAIYQGSSASFPIGTLVTNTGLIDALVYDTSDPDDPGLLDTLLFPAPDPRRVQVDENVNTKGTTESIQRCGTARRDGRVYKVAAPSEGLPNTCP
ncbi:MAG: Ig-like domain-containing protein [Hyalangium sp.]|uniref:Ig-like domain-containing protein n=1 Tax=Hyalangium sp. TaxID=2028555 RepID=UPI00389A256E